MPSTRCAHALHWGSPFVRPNAETISGRRVETRAARRLVRRVVGADRVGGFAPETWKTYRGYCTKHFLPFFESADRMTTSSAEDYSWMRLRNDRVWELADQAGSKRIRSPPIARSRQPR